MNTCARCGYAFSWGKMRIIGGYGGPDIDKVVCKDEQGCAMRVATSKGVTLWDAYAQSKGYR